MILLLNTGLIEELIIALLFIFLVILIVARSATLRARALKSAHIKERKRAPLFNRARNIN